MKKPRCAIAVSVPEPAGGEGPLKSSVKTGGKPVAIGENLW